MKKIILLLVSVFLAVQALAADFPPHFLGIWASDDAVFDGEWLVSGTAMYLDAQGNGVVMRGPVVASCKRVKCAKPVGMLFHASVGSDSAELVQTMKDMTGKVISGSSWYYKPKTSTFLAIAGAFEGTILSRRSKSVSTDVMQAYTETLRAQEQVLPKGYNVYMVPSASMEPTLRTGALLLVNQQACKNSLPERGDLIVYRVAEDRGGVWFRRIVALPGDMVEIKDWTLFVNGNAIDVPYASLPKGREKFSRKLAMLTVPAGTAFVMGDNWDNSVDSRLEGVIALQDIVGKIFAQKPSSFEGDFTPIK